MKSKKTILAVLGTVLLVGTNGTPAQQLIGDVAAGEAAFKARCATCHAVEAGGSKKKPGPHLQSIFGRTAGTQKGFRYSKTMRQSALVWDAYTLDNYLYDPPTTMKGTSMVLKTPDAKVRADLVAYMKTL